MAPGEYTWLVFTTQVVNQWPVTSYLLFVSTHDESTLINHTGAPSALAIECAIMLIKSSAIWGYSGTLSVVVTSTTMRNLRAIVVQLAQVVGHGDYLWSDSPRPIVYLNGDVRMARLSLYTVGCDLCLNAGKLAFGDHA